MSRAGSIRAGQELHGLVKLEQAGLTRELFSGMWEKEDWRKHAEFLLSISSPCMPSRYEGGRGIVHIPEGESAVS